MKTYSEHELQAVQHQHEPWLLSQPGVVGVGIGLGSGGQPALRIYTAGASQDVRGRVESRLPDVPVTWEEAGDVIAY